MSNKRKNNQKKNEEINKRKKVEEIHINTKEDLDKFMDMLFPPKNTEKKEQEEIIFSDGYDNCNNDEEKDIFDILNVETITLDKLIEWGDL